MKPKLGVNDFVAEIKGVETSLTHAINASQNLSLREAFETATQINKELKRTEFDVAFCIKFKLLIDRFSSFFRKLWKNR